MTSTAIAKRVRELMGFSPLKETPTAEATGGPRPHPPSWSPASRWSGAVYESTLQELAVSGRRPWTDRCGGAAATKSPRSLFHAHPCLVQPAGLTIRYHFSSWRTAMSSHMSAPVLLCAAAGLGATALMPARDAQQGTDRPRAAVAPVEIREWEVPWERSRPRDPHVDGEGRVWFVGQQGNYIAFLDPESGKFTQFAIDSGTHPH